MKIVHVFYTLFYYVNSIFFECQIFKTWIKYDLKKNLLAEMWQMAFPPIPQFKIKGADYL